MLVLLIALISLLPKFASAEIIDIDGWHIMAEGPYDLCNNDDEGFPLGAKETCLPIYNATGHSLSVYLAGGTPYDYYRNYLNGWTTAFIAGNVTEDIEYVDAFVTDNVTEEVIYYGHISNKVGLTCDSNGCYEGIDY
ncbi:hypothetical protein J4N42_15465 [Vibrio sp. SCSIO 43135]|uniref:hypothetical protein n=1 Tax=Vibrio sp. SCSIO 43135 TaxID=2819096 RepID=UPI0020750027|nr:hypothetical protein [Vibrio sp. SCSIO 43135]USD43574.1 hypothetical protein J4N42_15465 [Vibrio sp. SCSIO 43135]